MAMSDYAEAGLRAGQAKNLKFDKWKIFWIYSTI